MKYENAADVLPAALLNEVQKYAQGWLLYIPKNGKSMPWGEAGGCRAELDRRNAQIRARYASGRSIMEIAEEFFLAPDTVKKLVYGKKTVLPPYSPSAASAEAYAAAGMGEEWVRIFLSGMGKPLPDPGKYFLMGPVRIPLRLIVRENCGETQTDDVPLIVLYEDHIFRVTCQREYAESLRREKRNAHTAFIFARKEEYAFFMNNYGKHFQR